MPAAWADAARWAVVALWLAFAARRPAPGVATAVGVALALGAVLAGATLAGEHARRAAVGTAGTAGTDVVLTGRIVDVPRTHAGPYGAVASVTLRVESIAPLDAGGGPEDGGAHDGADDGAGGTARAVPRGTRVRVTVRGAAGGTLRAGERWRLAARLGELDGLANAGGFDRERWMLGARLHGRASALRAPAPTRDRKSVV